MLAKPVDNHSTSRGEKKVLASSNRPNKVVIKGFTTALKYDIIRRIGYIRYLRTKDGRLI
jgi:hypothetical protein